MSRVLACVALCAVLSLAWSRAAAEDAPAPSPRTPTEAERAEIQAMVDGLREEAARIRGLAWKERVPADLVTRAQMRADFMSELDTEYPPEKRARDLAILRRIGLVGPDQDPVAMMMDFMEAGVAGYYDPKKKHLRIVEGLAGKEQQPTILHELIHALEDQYYDLESRTKPFEDDSDRLFAEKCICEGSAEHARALYEAAHPELAETFRKAQINPEMARAQVRAFQKVPAWMFVPTLLHYEAGPAFAARHVKGGAYPERIDALYKSPPVSQEQILHPERWFGPTQDFPQRVVLAGDLAAAAGAGWKVLHQLPQGELDLALALDFFLGPTKGRYNFLRPSETPFRGARRAASGWDAGWAVALEKQGLPLVLVDVYAFDTPKDAWEAGELLGKAAEKAAGPAWTSAGWTREGPEGAPTRATLHYVNQHGASRLLVEGARVLRVDGAPVEVLEALWPTVLGTTFVADPRDTWVPGSENAAYERTGWKNAKLGAGLTPPAGWRVVPGGLGSNAFATAFRDEGRIEVQLSLIPQALTAREVLEGARGEIVREFPEFTGASLGSCRVGEAEGPRMALGRGEGGRYAELILAAGDARFYAVRLSAPDLATLDGARAELEALLASVAVRAE